MGRGRKGTGVEAREASIRVRFTWRTQRCAETLPLRPTGPNLKYAERLVADINRRIAAGNFDYAEFFPDSPRAARKQEEQRTFGTVADLWLRSKGQSAEATRAQYRNAVALWKRVLGADTPFSKLTHQHLASTIGGRTWASAAACNGYLIALRGIFSFEYHGLRAIEDPMRSIQNMPKVKKLPDPLSIQERDQIIEDMAKHYDPRVVAYFIFQFSTGMRPEEAIALQWGDIDWHARIARVQRVRTFHGSERDGSKTHGQRDVDLVSGALQALESMKPYTFLKNGDIFEDPILGKPWHDEAQQRTAYWYPSLKRCGIRKRRAYCTRHTYATAALMAGIPPAYIAAQLGHVNAAMVHEKYARWINGADQGGAKAMLERASTNLALNWPTKQVTS